MSVFVWVSCWVCRVTLMDEDSDWLCEMGARIDLFYELQGEAGIGRESWGYWFL